MLPALLPALVTNFVASHWLEMKLALKDTKLARVLTVLLGWEFDGPKSRSSTLCNYFYKPFREFITMSRKLILPRVQWPSVYDEKGEATPTA